MLLHRPLLSGNRVVGMLVAMGDLATQFSEFVAPISAGRLGSALVLDEDGTVLFASGNAEVGTDLLDDLTGRPEASASVRRLLSEASGAGDLITFEDGEDVRMLAAWNHVPLGDQDLILVLTAPDDVVAVNLSEPAPAVCGGRRHPAGNTDHSGFCPGSRTPTRPGAHSRCPAGRSRPPLGRVERQ